ncbi:four helix bundle protein [Aureibaculum sp. 2210JD6-5]|uniref:four helix bundle protein n=1 Tax=Aureibaculum sp. 2210JD6-5 TaxID=3103957 RepID=UPI002AAC8564|nr:four helix bundle protein [Aureibaculum sp. 2210JD6-5]MDY7395437.1 four helix bundle protein [Aureibaculum sp. 2210JD6-5]
MSFKTLLAYQEGFALAMEVYHISRKFPGYEQFGLSSQIVRSSRAVCSAIAEAYRKRQYEKHFKSKLSDADSENSETQLWLDFALACNYIDEIKRAELQDKSEEIGKLLNYMINNPNKFGL